MSPKRKKEESQPELPIEAVPDNTPGEVHAAPTPIKGNAAPAPAKPTKNGDSNGEEESRCGQRIAEGGQIDDEIGRHHCLYRIERETSERKAA